VGPPPLKGVATTSNTCHNNKKRNLPTLPPSGKRGSRCGFLLRGSSYTPIAFGEGMLTLEGACVYRYGPVTKSKLS